MGVTDYERMAGVYDRGREVAVEGLGEWRDALGPHVSGGGPVLDLGAGTGLWAGVFVEWFGVDVVAVEPSAAMRAQAVRKGLPGIAYVGGRAEEIPLRAGSCACAWLSTVVHHFTDPVAAARELWRVLAPGSAVLIRNAFADRCDGVTWLSYWPQARPLAERRWPTTASVAEIFDRAGFIVEELASIRQQTAPSLRAYRDRVLVRADSTLVELGDEEFRAGLEKLDAAVAAEREPRPVVDTLDLMVLRRRKPVFD